MSPLTGLTQAKEELILKEALHPWSELQKMVVTDAIKFFIYKILSKNI